jgi:hypothetical protein
LARFSKITAILVKYGVSAWALYNFDSLSLIFWVLLWSSMLAIESMRKSAQFLIPAKWENVSLKLDSEHFWLINLIVMGMVEIHISHGPNYGLALLVISYIFFAGESRSSILAAVEDVSACAWALIALTFLMGVKSFSIYEFTLFLMFFVLMRGIVRVSLGRVWLRRKFWWVAQFCLMTALIVKSMVVLNAIVIHNT